jgi:hypothetical protein
MQFNKPGPANTAATLDAAQKRAEALGIDEIVIATSSGNTIYQALELFPADRIIAVTYHCGFRKPFEKVMPVDTRKDLEAKGITVIAATHALSGVERSVFQKYQGAYPVLIIADTLRLLGQGVKVAVEIAVMAADAGVLSGRDIIAVGGTAKGADAAAVIRPAHMNSFFDLKIREIICKPN